MSHYDNYILFLLIVIISLPTLLPAFESEEVSSQSQDNSKSNLRIDDSSEEEESFSPFDWETEGSNDLRNSRYVEELENDDDFGVYGTLGNGLAEKIQSLMIMLLVETQRIDQLDLDVNGPILEGVRKSNDYLYRFKDMHEEIGINQEARDLIVKLIAQASENKKTIEKVRSQYRTGTKLAKKLHSRSMSVIGLLRQKFNEVQQLHREMVQKFEFNDLPNDKQKNIVVNLRHLGKDLPQVEKQEKELLRVLKMFMEEQIALVKLGKHVWLNSQEDYPASAVAESEAEFAAEQAGLPRPSLESDTNTRLQQIRDNKMQRQLLSAIQESKSKSENITSKSVKKEPNEEL